MNDGATLGNAIAATFATWERWPATRDLLIERERAMYGSVEPYAIAQLVDRFCAANLGEPIAAYLFYASSQGGVSGIELTDGQRVVVKAHMPTWTYAVLDTVHRVQRHLADRGFPCPRPILGPTGLGYGYATVEELVDEGEYADAHRPAIRRAMAETLARQISSTRDLLDTPELCAALRSRMPSRRPEDTLWPEPHSPIFDLPATAKGAEWIDRIAAGAREMLARGAGEEIIGHTDWSAQNCRFIGAPHCFPRPFDRRVASRGVPPTCAIVAVAMLGETN